MENLPLFYYPTTWLWVDDDKNLLDNIVLTFNSYNNIRPFSSAKESLDFLEKYNQPFSKFKFIKCLSDDDRYGILKHTPTDFDLTMLINISNDQTRHQEITAAVIDYKMPEIDGFNFAKKISHFSFKKILLTRAADSDDAILGFNNSLIHRYIQKFDAELVNKLIKYLQQITLEYFQKISSPLLLHIETENKLPLSDPIFISHFKKYCKINEIREYYLIDKQGSFLCIDKNNKKQCFMVQSNRNIDSFLSSYESELSSKNLKFIKKNKSIPFFGVGKEAWQFDCSEWDKYFYNTNILDGRERYYWASINL